MVGIGADTTAIVATSNPQSATAWIQGGEWHEGPAIQIASPRANAYAAIETHLAFKGFRAGIGLTPVLSRRRPGGSSYEIASAPAAGLKDWSGPLTLTSHSMCIFA